VKSEGGKNEGMRDRLHDCPIERLCDWKTKKNRLTTHDSLLTTHG